MPYHDQPIFSIEKIIRDFIILLCNLTTGEGSEIFDMCVYISLSISQNAIVLSPTKAF